MKNLSVKYCLGIILLCLSLSLWASNSPPSCDVGEMHENAPPETAQFAFLAGDFSVTLHARQGAVWTPPRPTNARWNGWYGLNGMAIVDEWFDPEPEIDPNGGRGINVRMYDQDEAVWKMMWISSSGKQVTDLRAKMLNGVLTMWQVYPEQVKKTRSEFEVIDDDHWVRVSYLQDDKTKEWSPQFRLAATRIPCEATD